jgi:hypothetical protein
MPRGSSGDSGIQSWKVPSALLTPLGRLSRVVLVTELPGMATDSAETPNVTLSAGPGLGDAFS